MTKRHPKVSYGVCQVRVIVNDMEIISALVYNLYEYGALFTAYMVHNLDDPW